MLTVFHPEHPHYVLHKQFVESCFKSPDNPPVVELKTDLGNWVISGKDWNGALEYRFKPKMLTRTVSYPEPLRVAPERRQKVWVVACEGLYPRSLEWEPYEWAKVALKNGMVFATEAAAQHCCNSLFGEPK